MQPQPEDQARSYRSRAEIGSRTNADPARPALAALLDLYRRFQGQPRDLQAARTFLRARFERGESIVFLARDAARAVGFAQLYPSFSSVALKRVLILNDLFVDPAARRRQVASELLRAAEAHAWAD
ncbi:MAG TPA: GNAT family N-acetyltransferase, partial [Burkholderiaceae bacterium]|nr:GNAT family N-acetyltransferase [Burkholderiaceae bacterium]